MFKTQLDELREDCRENLRALVELKANLPRECRLVTLEEARIGCRLLAEGLVLNPKLTLRTLQRYPFDQEVLKYVEVCRLVFDKYHYYR
jgi:hypothetical protein